MRDDDLILSELTSGMLTFVSSFNDLRENILGDVISVLHGSLPCIDPLCSSGAQQVARFPHFINKRLVFWLELEIQDTKMSDSIRDVNAIQVIPEKRCLGCNTPFLSDMSQWL